MRKEMFLWVALMAWPLAAQEKKDLELQTEVAEATVFIRGAQVTRKTAASFPAGRSTVRFVNLSPYIDAKSVQVKVDGEVMILSVNHQVSFSDTVRLSGEMETLRKQRKELNEKVRAETVLKTALNQELIFLVDNQKIGGTNGIDFDNLKTASTYYGERFAALKLKEIEIDRKIEDLSEEIGSIDRKIAVTGNAKPEPTGEVVLNIDCRTAVRVPVELSYYVNNAGWFPSYDIRAKSISEPVELAYKANVMQNTKETWRSIRLKVSSASPNLGNVAPKLVTYRLDYYTRPPRYDTNSRSNQVSGRILDAATGEPLAGATAMIQGSTIGTAADLSGHYVLSIPAGGGVVEASYIGYKTKAAPIRGDNLDFLLEEDAASLEDVVVVGYASGRSGNDMASAERSLAEAKPSSLKAMSKSVPVPVARVENQTAVTFEIKTPYTIPSENRSTTIEVERYSVPAEYEYYCVPKIYTDAFLLANISGWEQYNLLEGEANIFFENTFVGKTILDVRSPGDTLNLSLGRDRNVSVKREKVREYSTQKFLGSRTETTRDWKITVRNNKRQPVPMVIFDQIPVSILQEIEVNAENLSGG
ncbi:MAG: mucoidy inhibitor MuiA family protein, partial [Tannerella sp.]|nr:mucoidy inhibitor MuiA family protein [Tannerella sp.]